MTCAKRWYSQALVSTSVDRPHRITERIVARWGNPEYGYDNVKMRVDNLETPTDIARTMFNISRHLPLPDGTNDLYRAAAEIQKWKKKNR